MENPFDSGHIKNYMILYASVVVIMILFFMASTLFIDVKKMDKKIFSTQSDENIQVEKIDKTQEEQRPKPKFGLLEKAY